MRAGESYSGAHMDMDVRGPCYVVTVYLLQEEMRKIILKCSLGMVNMPCCTLRLAMFTASTLTLCTKKRSAT